jgi:hypothetical protein
MIGTLLDIIVIVFCAGAVLGALGIGNVAALIGIFALIEAPRKLYRS